MIKKSYLKYLFCLFLFKLAVGAILLVTSWDVLTLSNNALLNVSLLMALSFTPAAFARPLFNKLVEHPVEKIIFTALISSAVLIIVEYYLIISKSNFVFLANFALWILIFLIEVSSEKWYVALSQNTTLSDIRKLSGISTSIAQLGIILGPVMVMFVRLFSHSCVYWLISAVMCFAAISPLVSFRQNAKICSPKSSPQSVADTIDKGKKLAYVLAFSMIWPTLVIFNISAPILSKLQYHTINIAGTMEVLIGFATALSGFVYPSLTKFSTSNKRLFSVLILLSFFTMLIYLAQGSIMSVYIGTFFTGLTFGYLRVELRTFLSRRYTAKVAGEIVAAANSWSAPLVLIYCLLFYFNANTGVQKGITILFPLSFIITALIFIFLLFVESKYNEESI